MKSKKKLCPERKKESLTTIIPNLQQTSATIENQGFKSYYIYVYFDKSQKNSLVCGHQQKSMRFKSYYHTPFTTNYMLQDDLLEQMGEIRIIQVHIQPSIQAHVFNIMIWWFYSMWVYRSKSMNHLNIPNKPSDISTVQGRYNFQTDFFPFLLYCHWHCRLVPHATCLVSNTKAVCWNELDQFINR